METGSFMKEFSQEAWIQVFLLQTTKNNSDNISKKKEKEKEKKFQRIAKLRAALSSQA